MSHELPSTTDRNFMDIVCACVYACMESVESRQVMMMMMAEHLIDQFSLLIE